MRKCTLRSFVAPANPSLGMTNVFRFVGPKDGCFIFLFLCQFDVKKLGGGLGKMKQLDVEVSTPANNSQTYK